MTRSVEVRLDAVNASLYALDQGEGPPLIFFHGGLGDHRAALGLIGPIADRVRLITPDLRAAGRSHWSGALTWELLAADAAALAAHLGLERVVVGGVSMGSAVALRMALDHPDLVAGLALVHPVYPGGDRPLDGAVVQAMAAMHALGRRAPEEGIEILVPLFEALPDEIRSRAVEMVRSFDPDSVATTTALLASCAQPLDTRQELRSVACPVVVVPGADPHHPAEVAVYLAGALPSASLERVEGPALVEALAGFCASLERSGAL